MGVCQSKNIVEPDDGSVDNFLLAEQEKRANEKKVLLLGAGESGKSTVVKQCKVLYVKGGLTQEDKLKCARALKHNTLQSVEMLVTARKTMGIDLEQQDNEIIEVDLLAAAKAAGEQGDAVTFTPEMATKVSTLWADTGMQAVYKRRNEFHLLDGAGYYLDECKRFAEEDFEDEVTEDDILMARILTQGVEETCWNERGGLSFKVIDVAGQRSARKKWIDYFDDINALVFLAGLSGFNQVIMDDGVTNRMKESLDLFEDITKQQAFHNCPVFLFLNKKDLFEDLIRDFDICDAFPEYTGPKQDMLAALEFIKGKFVEVFERTQPGRAQHLVIHVVAARVRMDMKVAFGDLRTLIKQNHTPFVAPKDKKSMFASCCGPKKPQPFKEGTTVVRKNILK